MLVLLRHVFAFLALPFTVTVVVPIYLLRGAQGSDLRAGASALLCLRAAGVLFLLVGLALFVSSLYHFATRGRGTLAPWDPPTVFVVTGPYRYVRNPMISGVIAVLLSEAAMLGSAALLVWAATFTAINLVYIPLVEEPSLQRRFGDAYREYRRHVHRFVPRLSPWGPPSGPDSVG